MVVRAQVFVLGFFVLLVQAWSLNLQEENETNTTLSKLKVSPDDKGRVFSLFSIVTFKNSACTSKTDSTMKGTCYTASECTNKGGTSGGNCAAGFGVCCMFTLSSCGTTVTQNCTYIQNPSYPSSYSSTSVTCSYSVSPVQSDICQLRLDFTNFVTSVTSVTGVCADSFIATTPSGVTTTTICGTNTGLHMYVDTGTSTSATTLAFTIGSTSATRTWKIKVSQIECWNTAKAPPDCRQYFTGATGTFKSYNFGGGLMLAGQMYTYCFRQELGYCQMDYFENASTSPDPFYLGPAPATAAVVGTGCASTAALIIPGDQGNAGQFCGTYLASVIGMVISGIVRQPVSPFTVSVISTIASQVSTTGYNLVFNQVPCF